MSQSEVLYLLRRYIGTIDSVFLIYRIRGATAKLDQRGIISSLPIPTINIGFNMVSSLANQGKRTAAPHDVSGTGSGPEACDTHRGRETGVYIDEIMESKSRDLPYFQSFYWPFPEA